MFYDHFSARLLLYGVVGVVSVPTTTHFNKMCCYMVLWVLFPIQRHILLKCVVVGTRNNTHNTIQQHTLSMLTHYVNVVVVCHLCTIVNYRPPAPSLQCIVIETSILLIVGSERKIPSV